MHESAEVVICGAGIAGISTAYQLSVNHGISDIVLLDPNPPLSLTSDHSTECYRNWWPGPGTAMVSLMNRSISLMEDIAEAANNQIHLNRRGYLYLTADQKVKQELQTSALEISRLGAGSLNIHDGKQADTSYNPEPPDLHRDRLPGADLVVDQGVIHSAYPYLNENISAALHVRRAGWLSAQQLGMLMYDMARNHGTRYIQTKVAGFALENECISGVKTDLGQLIHTNTFINAAGPFANKVCKLLNTSLPVYNELHLKVAINDYLGVIDRSAPLLIWNDPQKLPWSPEERQFLEEDEGYRWLLNELPPGVHMRPEGGQESQIVLLMWEYHSTKVPPEYPIPIDPLYAEVVLRGLVRMLPGMRAYVDKIPRPRIDGGYYTRTRENRPLIGKLPVGGAYIIGALSGFGIMAACGAGELLAAHITGSDLPGYAPAFDVERYTDPEYLNMITDLDETGQL